MGMMDTDVTYTFVTEKTVKSLHLTSRTCKIEVVNFEARTIMGTTNVPIQIGPWIGMCNMMAVAMDDFELIIGKQFMQANKIFPIPHLNGIMIVDARCPTFVSAFGAGGQSSANNKVKDKSLTVIQVANCLKHEKVIYLAVLAEIKPNVYQEVPDAVAQMLDKFAD